MNGQLLVVGALVGYLAWDRFRRPRRNPAAQLSLFSGGGQLRGKRRRQRTKKTASPPSGAALVTFNERGDRAQSAGGTYRIIERRPGRFDVRYSRRGPRARTLDLWQSGTKATAVRIVQQHAQDVAAMRRRNPRKHQAPQLQIGLFGQGSQPSLGLGAAADEADDPSKSAQARADQKKIAGLKSERGRLKAKKLYTPDLDVMIDRAEQRYRQQYGVTATAPQKRKRRKKTGTHTGKLIG